MINQLIKPIIFLMAIALPLWILVRIWLNASRKKRNESISIKRELTLTAFFICIIFVAAVTLMPLPMTSFKNSDAANTNFIPLINSIECFLPNRTGVPEIWKHCLENIAGNIVLFFPLGALLPLISDKFQFLKSVIIVAVLFSIIIELIQFLAQYFGSFRTVDIDDVIFNASGACAGFYVCKLAGFVSENSGELPAVNL